MKNCRAGVIMILAGAIAVPASNAADLPGSAAIDRLLTDVTTQASRLKADSGNLKAFTESNTA